MSAATVSKACKPNVLMLILLMTFVSFSAADCPDADVRCRIPASDADTTVSGLASYPVRVHVLPKRRALNHLCASREAVPAAAEVGAPPVELRETCQLA